MVREKLVESEPATAVTEYGPPAIEFAVKVPNVPAVATPDPLVMAVIVLVELLNVPLAPVAGAVKVTLAPDMATPPASFTVTASPLANA